MLQLNEWKPAAAFQGRESENQVVFFFVKLSAVMEKKEGISPSLLMG